MIRYIIILLTPLLCFQLHAQTVQLGPLNQNPVLLNDEQNRTLSVRSNGYSEEITIFRGETVLLCADTTRLDTLFNQITNEECSPLDYGSSSLDGHCIEFTASNVDRDRNQKICLDVEDVTGTSFTWTINIDIRIALPLPFVEDFYENSHRPDPEKWLDREIYVNDNWAKDPVSIGVATFDGIDENGSPYEGGQVYADTLTSAFIDLSETGGGNPVYLTFWIQPGGLGSGFAPNPEDSLFLEFKNQDGNWNQVFSTEGTDSVEGEDFEFVSILVNPPYLHEQFQFRFFNHSSLDGITDLWHLDYLKLSQDADPDIYERDISFTRPPSPMLEPYTSMPWHHFSGNEVKYTRDSLRIGLFGHFEETALADSSRFIIREDKTGVEVLPFETLLEVPPFVDQNQPNVAYGSQKYKNVIKDLDGIQNTLKNAFDSDEMEYIFTSTYSFSQAQEVLEEWKKNNTVRRKTSFGDYFAYDDGSAEAGLFLTPGSDGEPSLAVEYTAEVGDTLKGIHMLLPHVQMQDQNQQISLKIWTGSLNNEPIYTDAFLSPIFPDQYFDTLGGFTTFALKSSETGNDTALYIPEGTFYVGWTQHTIFNEVGMYVGFDRNSPEGVNHTYFSGGGEQWIPLKDANPRIEGSVMIRPVFGDQTLFTTEASEPQSSDKISLFPNPGDGVFSVDLPEEWPATPQFEVWNVQGEIAARGTLKNKTLTLAELPDGMYFIRFQWPEKEYTATKRIIISN